MLKLFNIFDNKEVENIDTPIVEELPVDEYSFRRRNDIEVVKNDMLLGLIIETEDKHVFYPKVMNALSFTQEELEYILSLLKELNKPFN